MAAAEDEVDIADYYMPSSRDMNNEDLLTQSQYAKVVFLDLLPEYPTDADIWCRYTVTSGVKIRHGDRVAVYPVGWSNVREPVHFELAPVPAADKPDNKEFQILFKAEHLPKDTNEYYQLCYVNVDSSVCGASVPFQFRRVRDDELCEIEEQGGLMVVRSRTAVNEDKLREALQLIDEQEKKISDHATKTRDLDLITEQLSETTHRLQQVSEEQQTLHRQLQYSQLQIQSLTNEKTEAESKLETAQSDVEKLGTMFVALSKEKAELAEQLANRTGVDNLEISHLRAQVDNMQQMLDASTQSKEMASQALHCEQSKVRRLNIEHDKYKFRAQQLEGEKCALEGDKKRLEEELEVLNARFLEAQDSWKPYHKMVNDLEREKRSLESEKKLLEEEKLELEGEVRHWKGSSNRLEEGERYHKMMARELEVEKRTLQTEVAKWRECSEAMRKESERHHSAAQAKTEECDILKTRYQEAMDNITVLKRKFGDCDGLADRFQCLMLEVQQTREARDTLQAQLTSLQAQYPAHSYDALAEDYAEITKQLETSRKEIENMRKENAKLEERYRHVVAENATVRLLETENCALRFENQALHRCKVNLKQARREATTLKQQLADTEKKPAALMTEIKRLEVDKVIMANRIQAYKRDKTKETLKEHNEHLQRLLEEAGTGDARLAELNRQLAAAEESNASLKEELERMKMSSSGGDTSDSDASLPVDLSLTVRLMEMQNRKANLEIQLVEAKVADDMAKQRDEFNRQRLGEIDEEIALNRSRLAELAANQAADKNNLVQITAHMEGLQADILRDDQSRGASFNDFDEGRLERMLKRSHDLECQISAGTSQMYDAEQNLLVLQEEGAGLREELEQCSQDERERVEKKCQLLEQLIEMDRRIAEAGRLLYKREEGEIEAEKFRRLNSIDERNVAGGVSYEMVGSDYVGGVEVNGNKDLQKGGEGENVERAVNEVNFEIGKAVNEESVQIEMAVTEGIQAGVIRGLNDLRLVAEGCVEEETEAYDAESARDMQSLSRAEWEVVEVEQRHTKTEQTLKEQLAAVLQTTVRQGLLPGGGRDEVGGGGEKELQLRLDLAAEEYRKIYVQKLRAEKRLAKMKEARGGANTGSPGSSLESSGPDPGYACSTCSVTFPLSATGLFLAHLEDHMS